MEFKRGYHVKNWHLVKNHPLGFIVTRTKLNITERNTTVTEEIARSTSFPRLRVAIERFTGETYEVNRIKTKFYFKTIK